MIYRAIPAVALALVLLAQWAAAQIKYPQSNVTLVVHSSPGGGSDVFMRGLAPHLGRVMGVAFAVENVPGGSSIKAVTRVASAAPDGATFYATNPTYIQTTLLSKPPVGYTNLDPVAIVFFDPQAIYTRADAPWKTLAEVIEYAKKQRGKAKWGGSLPGGTERFALERLKKRAGVTVPVVPHDGGGDTLLNVLNGTLDIAAGEVQELRGQVEAKKIRLLAVFMDKRLPSLPDVPTVKEQGFDVVTRVFRGIAGPKGIPDNVADMWHAALKKVLDTPAYQAEYAKHNLVPGLMGREEARKFTMEIAKETQAALKEFGIVP